MDGTGRLGASAADDEAAGVALDALTTLPTAKRIAATALYVQAMRPLTREDALACAARVHAARFGPSRGGLKKAVSESRAILQFGRFEPERLDEALRGPSGEMLAGLEAAMRQVSLREVTRARAAVLAGGRGGRPMARPSATYSAVRKLLQLAEAGDSGAQAELSAIDDLIRGSAPALLARTADRPAANR